MEERSPLQDAPRAELSASEVHSATTAYFVQQEYLDLPTTPDYSIMSV
jgi:hypothetical protein